MKKDQSKKQQKVQQQPQKSTSPASQPNSSANKSTVTSTTNTTSLSGKTLPFTTKPALPVTATQKPQTPANKPTSSDPAKSKNEPVSANDAFQKAFLNLSKTDQKRTVKDIKDTANLLSFFQDKQINILQLANSFGLNVDKQSDNGSGNCKMSKGKSKPQQQASDESRSFLNLYLEASKKANENDEKIKILINQQAGDKQQHSSSSDEEEDEIDCLDEEDDEYLDEDEDVSEIDAQWEAALLDPRQHSKIIQQSQIIASIKKIMSEEDKTISDGNLLLLASSSGIYELAHCLLSAKSDTNQQPQHSIKLLNRCLLQACASGHVEIVKLLLEKGAEVTYQTRPKKNISLHFAALHGHLGVIKLLVKHVQDQDVLDGRHISLSQFIEMANQDGHTALIHSASANQVECARYLINEHNASIRCPPAAEFKDSALSLACYKGNYEMVKFLLELDNGHLFSKQELTDSLLETSVEGHVDIAKLLIDKGASVITPKDSFESCLNLAAGGNHIELACLLLSKGSSFGFDLELLSIANPTTFSSPQRC